MTGALSIDPASLSQKLVIPVRYVAQGQVLQTTSTAIGEEVLHVRSPRPPPPGLFVGFKLYFERGEEVARAGVVSWVTAGKNSGFWTRFSEEDGAKDRVAALLARYRKINDRGCRRFHTNMAATIRKEGRVASRGEITNISQSGAFMKVAVLPPAGTVVDLDVHIPGQTVADTVHAYVVHVAPRRGVGLQFVGSSDLFRAHLDEYLNGLP
jgi:PilZ domain